jgi:hypothetical protein
LLKNYTKVFLEGDKVYLVIEEAVMHLKLTVDQKDLVKKYLGVVELLLTETDALVRENLIAEIDSVTEDLYKFLSQNKNEGLVGLKQVCN